MSKTEVIPLNPQSKTSVDTLSGYITQEEVTFGFTKIITRCHKEG